MQKLFLLLSAIILVYAVQGQTFTNGLTASTSGQTTTVKLGGPLTGTTTVDLMTYTFGFRTAALPTLFTLTNNGKVGVGITPTSLLHLKAGTAAASTAPLKFTSGVNLTTPEAGTMEFNGSALFFTPSTARKEILFADLSNITGILPTNKGGTGLSTVGSNGQVLSVVSGVPAWITPGTSNWTLSGSDIYRNSNVAVGGAFSPLYGLDARGQIRVAGTEGVVGAIGGAYPLSVQNNGVGSWIEILNNGGAGKGSFIGMDNNMFELWNFQGGDMNFYTGTTPTAGTNRMTIKNTGEVKLSSLATTATAPTTSGTIKYVITDGNGQLSFTDGGGSAGVSSMAAVGTAPNVNGGTISGNTLTLQPASASYGGVITTGIQSFSGLKSFVGNSGNISLYTDWNNGGGGWINFSTDAASGIGSGGPGSSAWIAYSKNAGQWFTAAASGDICYRNLSGRMLFGNSTTYTMAVANNSVGIGTTTPRALLDVTGDVMIGSLSNAIKIDATGIKMMDNSDLRSLEIQSTKGNYGQVNYQTYSNLNTAVLNAATVSDGAEIIRFRGNTNTAYISMIQHATNYMSTEFVQNGVSQMYLSPNSSVGINTTTPNQFAKLDVNGNIFSSGKIVIGTTDMNKVGSYSLAVNGDAIFNKVKVKLYSSPTSWPDYVFDNDYALPTLQFIEGFIKKYKHLPEVPSAGDVEKEGIDVGGMQAVLLKKVEELTLYLIELNKKVEALSQENELLKKTVNISNK